MNQTSNNRQHTATNEGLIKNLYHVALNIEFNTRIAVNINFDNASGTMTIVTIEDGNQPQNIIIDTQLLSDDILTAHLLYVIAVLHTASITGKINWDSLQRGYPELKSEDISYQHNRDCIIPELENVVDQYINWNGINAKDPNNDVMQHLRWYISFDSTHDYNLPAWHSVDDIVNLYDDDDWSEANTFIEHTVLRYSQVFDPHHTLYSNDDLDTFERYGKPRDKDK